MAAYIIVDGLVIDADKMEQYKVLAKPLVESFGGEYLARGGALSVKENQRWTPNRLVLLKFPCRFHLWAANRFFQPRSARLGPKRHCRWTPITWPR